MQLLIKASQNKGSVYINANFEDEEFERLAVKPASVTTRVFNVEPGKSSDEWKQYDAADSLFKAKSDDIYNLAARDMRAGARPNDFELTFAGGFDFSAPVNLLFQFEVPELGKADFEIQLDPSDFVDGEYEVTRAIQNAAWSGVVIGRE